MDILVTVGMSSWPFDRLLRAIVPLCHKHQVFAQFGMSKVMPPCAGAPYVPYDELMERVRAADVVITHAGNTVRVVQRYGKVPIAVARMAAAGEMANDHQVEYLRDGRVVAIWDLERLPHAVEEHAGVEARMISERQLSRPADAAHVIAVLDDLWDRLDRNRRVR